MSNKLTLAPLENKCDNCRGKGQADYGSGPKRCTVCKGAGYVPTELGERILELVRHNFKSMLSVAQPQDRP